MENIVIGIEGLVGSGKTSICRELLNRIPNRVVLHGGNLYRGIVYALMQENKGALNNMKNLQESVEQIDIKKVMDMLNVEIKIENKESVVYVKGKKIDEEKLQSKEASMAVSVAGGSADNSNLFVFFRNYIDELKENHNVILSGRALNEIYPSLDYHLFITASLDERVRRKALQYGDNVDLEELREHISKRDELQRKAGFYDFSEKTIEIDVTDCKSVEESTDKVCENISKKHLGDTFQKQLSI